MEDFDRTVEVRADTVKGRPYIQHVGFFREADDRPSLDALRREARKFQGPFEVVTDISKFLLGLSNAADAIQQGGELVKEFGRRPVVRVTCGIVTGLMQLKRLVGGVLAEDETVRYATSICDADDIPDHR